MLITPHPLATLHAHPHQTFKMAKQTITALKKKKEKKKGGPEAVTEDYDLF